MLFIALQISADKPISFSPSVPCSVTGSFPSLSVFRSFAHVINSEAWDLGDWESIFSSPMNFLCDLGYVQPYEFLLSSMGGDNYCFTGAVMSLSVWIPLEEIREQLLFWWFSFIFSSPLAVFLLKGSLHCLTIAVLIPSLLFKTRSFWDEYICICKSLPLAHNMRDLFYFIPLFLLLKDNCFPHHYPLNTLKQWVMPTL